MRRHRAAAGAHRALLLAAVAAAAVIAARAPAARAWSLGGVATKVAADAKAAVEQAKGSLQQKGASPADADGADADGADAAAAAFASITLDADGSSSGGAAGTRAGPQLIKTISWEPRAWLWSNFMTIEGAHAGVWRARACRHVPAHMRGGDRHGQAQHCLLAPCGRSARALTAAPAECDHLRDMGAANLVKSDVVDSDTGAIISSQERTSRCAAQRGACGGRVRASCWGPQRHTLWDPTTRTVRETSKARPQRLMVALFIPPPAAGSCRAATRTPS